MKYVVKVLVDELDIRKTNITDFRKELRQRLIERERHEVDEPELATRNAQLEFRPVEKRRQRKVHAHLHVPLEEELGHGPHRPRQCSCQGARDVGDIRTAKNGVH